MNKKLLIAGGGTGGHIFPGIAIAEEWVRQGGAAIFVGTRQGQEGGLIPKHGFVLRTLRVGRLKGGSWMQKMMTILFLPFSLLQAFAILWQDRPNVVLGIGGYASGPVCVAAKLCAIPTAITDQNVQPGMTNRILGKIVRRIFVSFKESEHFFPKTKLVVTGNPVRSAITFSPYEMPKDVFRLFIFGGSQGAQALNDVILGLIEASPSLANSLNIVHQTGLADVERIRDFYRGKNIPAVVNSFFDNMNELYRQAHLVLCRAGAGTLTELALSGRPSLLVPYPFAADDHQKKNAEVFVAAGAAWMIEQKDLTAPILSDKIFYLKNHPEVLALCAKKAAEIAVPDAAERVAEGLLALC